MKEKIIIILAAFLVFIALLSADHYRNRAMQLESERNRLSVELSHAQIPLQRDTIRDSIEVVTQTVVEVVPKKLKEAILKDTTFYYNIRDSLSIAVYREYRYHFLWWKWGTKGYRLKIVNFNPHSKVTYNKYIKAGK